MRSIALALPLMFAAFATSAADPANVMREEVGNRVSENVPAIPAELRERLNQYQNTRGANFAGWLKDGSILITTRFAETAQVHRVRAPLGMREQLTFYPEPVRSVASAPVPAGNGFVFGKDVGGSEFWHLYRYDVDGRRTSQLTQGERSRNDSPMWSDDGRQLAFSSTARNGTDSDIWLLDVASGQTRNLVTEGGTWTAMDFSPDGKRLLVSKYVSANESYPGEVDLETGKLRMFPVDGGKAAFGAFLFTPDGKGSYFVSDENSEFLTLRHHDIAKQSVTELSKNIPWDVEDVALAKDGKHLAFASNEDGISKLHVLTVPAHTPVPMPDLPIGVITAMDFSPDGKKLALSINSATSPSDVYVIDLVSRKLARWTQSEVGGLDPARFVAPTLVHYKSFDGRSIPAFYYRPASATGKVPVIIQIHGGPESQAQPAFSANIQFLVNELKVAVLVPNVRGSSGYGKAYLQLDNGLLRRTR